MSCLANGKLAGNKTWKHCKKILRANLPAVMAAVDPATIPEQVIAEVRVFLRDPRCSIGVLGRACEPCVPLAEWARQCLTIHRICPEYGQEKTEPQAAFQYVLQCVKQEHEEKMRPAVEDVNAALDALGAAEVRGSKLSEFRDNFQKMKTLWTFAEILNKYFSKPCEDVLQFLKRNNLFILPFIISFSSSLITMTGDESPVAGESEPGYDPSFSSGLRHPRQGGRSLFFSA